MKLRPFVENLCISQKIEIYYQVFTLKYV